MGMHMGPGPGQKLDEFKQRKEDLLSRHKRRTRLMFLGFGLLVVLALGGSYLFFKSCVKSSMQGGMTRIEAEDRCFEILNQFIDDDD